MEYIDVKWLHDNDQDPVRLVSELDAQRFEVRKLEFFPSGSVGFASEGLHTSNTELGTMAVPPLDEINASPEFSGVSIAAATFERLWHEHVQQCA